MTSDGHVYCGPYADTVGYDAHEGNAGQILADGNEARAWTEEFTAYRARCACGWSGETTHPTTEDDEELAKDDWRTAHLRPFIRAAAARHVVPATTLIDLLDELCSQLNFSTDDQEDRVLTAHSGGVPDAIERVEWLLDQLTRDNGPL